MTKTEKINGDLKKSWKAEIGSSPSCHKCILLPAVSRRFFFIMGESEKSSLKSSQLIK